MRPVQSTSPDAYRLVASSYTALNTPRSLEARWLIHRCQEARRSGRRLVPPHGVERTGPSVPPPASSNFAIEIADLPDDPVARLKQLQDCNGEVSLSLDKFLDASMETLTSCWAMSRPRFFKASNHLVLEIAFHLDQEGAALQKRTHWLTPSIPSTRTSLYQPHLGYPRDPQVPPPSGSC